MRLLPIAPHVRRSLAVVAALMFCGCGGGGSSGASSGPFIPGSSPTVSPTPTSTPAVTKSTVTGKVVDYDSQAPLSGVAIAVGTWTFGAASPAPTATTAPDGTFSIALTPGTYEFQIGAASPSDTRATLTTSVTVTSSPTTPLTVPTAPPQPNVTPDPVQLSGHFRLKALSADDQGCLHGASAQFGQSYFMDEYVWEAARWTNHQAKATPGGGQISMNTQSGAYAMLQTLYGTAKPFAEAYGETGMTYVDDANGVGSVIANDIKPYVPVPWAFGINCDRGGTNYATGIGAADVR